MNNEKLFIVERNFLPLSELLKAEKSFVNSHSLFYKVSITFPLAHSRADLFIRVSSLEYDGKVLILIVSWPGAFVTDPSTIPDHTRNKGAAWALPLSFSSLSSGAHCHTSTHTSTREWGAVLGKWATSETNRLFFGAGFFLITRLISICSSFLPGNAWESASQLWFLLPHI